MVDAYLQTRKYNKRIYGKGKPKKKTSLRFMPMFGDDGAIGIGLAYRF